MYDTSGIDILAWILKINNTITKQITGGPEKAS